MMEEVELANPIIKEYVEGDNFLSNIEDRIKDDTKNNRIIMRYPVVYIHTWKNKKSREKKYSVYVGESNNIVKRTKEHFKDAKTKKDWHKHLVEDNATPKVYVIGHEHFTKSMTLDIENKIYYYFLCADSVSHIYNGRGNPQGEYYSSDEMKSIFDKIWKKLSVMDSRLFLPEDKIINSAIYKFFPLVNLTKGQNSAKELITNFVFDNLSKKRKGNLIFIEGDAGTGKTVLTIRTFFEVVYNGNKKKNTNISMIVNNKELLKIYKLLVKKLGIKNPNGEPIIQSAQEFINSHEKNGHTANLVFVDEAHLLKTRKGQAFYGNHTYQLDAIMDLAKVTVVLFDRNQIMNVEQYLEDKELKKKKDLAKQNDTYFKLEHQLRIAASKSTIEWIDNITKEKKLNVLEKDAKGYEVKVFNSPKELFDAIKAKSKERDSKLSRVIATYDWDYKSDKTKRPPKGKYWEVRINDFHKPWNNELSISSKTSINIAPWIERKETINEIGSIFTIQGFDLSYAGVIIGPSIIYRDGKIMVDITKGKNTKVNQKRTLSNGEMKSFAEELKLNELRVLLTRGVKGLYIYAVDDGLREALLGSVK